MKKTIISTLFVFLILALQVSSLEEERIFKSNEDGYNTPHEGIDNGWPGLIFADGENALVQSPDRVFDKAGSAYRGFAKEKKLSDDGRLAVPINRESLPEFPATSYVGDGPFIYIFDPCNDPTDPDAQPAAIFDTLGCRDDCIELGITDFYECRGFCAAAFVDMVRNVDDNSPETCPCKDTGCADACYPDEGTCSDVPIMGAVLIPGGTGDLCSPRPDCECYCDVTIVAPEFSDFSIIPIIVIVAVSLVLIKYKKSKKQS